MSITSTLKPVRRRIEFALGVCICNPMWPWFGWLLGMLTSLFGMYIGIQDKLHMWCRYKTVLKRPLAIQKELQINSNRDNYKKNRNQIKRFSTVGHYESSAASMRTWIWEWEMLWLWLKYPSLSRDTLRCTTTHRTQSMETKPWTSYTSFFFLFF